jgi:hypothetical protein
MKHAQEGMVGTGFAAFDEATNGLHASEAYLVYGAAGLGKSTFALSFISEGLVAGEAVALVTSRSPASVMEQARHSGLDFEAAFQDNRLFLFEYPEDIAGNSSRLLDDLRIVEEFRAALAGSSVQRVVFDPITPLPRDRQLHPRHGRDRALPGRRAGGPGAGDRRERFGARRDPLRRIARRAPPGAGIDAGLAEG